MMNGVSTMGPFAWIIMLLFWGVVILGLVIAVRWFVNRDKTEDEGTGPQTALEILKRRFARGEITREEFERMKKDLE